MRMLFCVQASVHGNTTSSMPIQMQKTTNTSMEKRRIHSSARFGAEGAEVTRTGPGAAGSRYEAKEFTSPPESGARDGCELSAESWDPASLLVLGGTSIPVDSTPSVL